MRQRTVQDAHAFTLHIRSSQVMLLQHARAQTHTDTELSTEKSKKNAQDLRFHERG